jgi:two-component system, LytTR family, response regulator
MRAIIVDDEPLARQTIASIVSSGFPHISIVAQAGSVAQGVEAIKNHQPDIVFLDVDLPDGTGFDILTLVKPITFRIIFITAHQEYALKAIKFSALDYILKPVSQIELTDAVKKITETPLAINNNVNLETFFNHIASGNSGQKRIVLKTSESIHVVDISDIIRCQADNNYTTFFTQQGERIIISKGIGEYDDLLSNFGFFRVHQSHLVNTSYIKRYDKKDGGTLILSDKSQIPVSQRKKQSLLDLFGQIR